MADIQSFIELMKDKKLHEARNPEQLSGEILKKGQQLKGRMLQIMIGYEALTDCIQDEKLRGWLKLVPAAVHDGYREVDGWYVNKSIEAEGVKLQKEKEQKGLSAIFNMNGATK